MKKSFFNAALWAMLATIGGTYVLSAHAAVDETPSPQAATASGSTPSLLHRHNHSHRRCHRRFFLIRRAGERPNPLRLVATCTGRL